MLDANKVLRELKENGYVKVFYFVPCDIHDTNADFKIVAPKLNGNRPFSFYISQMKADEFVIHSDGNVVPLDSTFIQEEECGGYIESTLSDHGRFPIGIRGVCPSLFECFHTFNEAEGVAFYLCNRYNGEILNHEKV